MQRYEVVRKKYEAAGSTVDMHKLALQEYTNKVKQMKKEKQCLRRQLEKKQCELNYLHFRHATLKKKTVKFKNKSNSVQRKLDEKTQVSDSHTPMHTRSYNTTITK